MDGLVLEPHVCDEKLVVGAKVKQSLTTNMKPDICAAIVHCSKPVTKVFML